MHVVAGVIRDSCGRVLLAQRPAGKHLAGGWEFPGGKLEAGEGRRAGLARELGEELGLTLDDARPLMRLIHSYTDCDIDLDAWLVTAWRGEPRGLDGQLLRWCAPADLALAGLLPADVPIVTALRLPERIAAAAGPGFIVVAPAALPSPICGDGGHKSLLVGIFCEQLADALAAVAGGADFIVLRRELPDEQLRAVCDAVAVPVYARGIAIEQARQLGASGVGEL